MTVLRRSTSEIVQPRWLAPLMVWRTVSAGLLIIGMFATLLRVGVDTTGPVRWTAAASLASVAALAVWATVATWQRRHHGRLGGFVVDMIVAVTAGFIGLNRMEMFTGLDAVGEAFNGSAGWLLVVLLGFVVSGLAERGGPAEQGLRSISRWTMLAGFAVLILSMGAIPGIIEFFRRLLDPDVAPVMAIALLGAASARLLWSDDAARWFGTSQTQGEVMDGLFFAAPNTLGFLTFFAGPLIVSLFISFTEWDGLTDARFVGLQNYIDLLSDDLFMTSLRNILVFGVIAIPAAVIPALFLASLLNSKLPGMKAFRAIYFLPSIAGVVGVTLIWKQLFNSTVGYINYMILRATELVNGVFGAGLDAPQPQWISDSNIALFAVIILFAWQQIGFNTVLFLAGMQGIDGSLYEAADIDGAGPWSRFRNITIPMLRPTTVFVVSTTTILALQMFNEPFILQAPSTPAGPNNSTLTPVVYLYQNAFQQFEIGYASAVAWVLFLLIFGVTLLYFRRSGDEGVFN